ncbi:MAG: hypothetical protein LBG80_14320 [Bacteroidales bacterium]|jgi:hypothetical protein|nr:hypothetical protein [Bacteroidales bacterium]
MIEIQEIRTTNIQKIVDMLLEQGSQPFEIYVPKSTQMGFSEQSAIADDYALLAYAGQRLKDVSDEFSYGYVSPSEHRNVLYRVKTNNIIKLAETLLELSYDFNNESDSDEYIPFEDVYSFISKVQSSEITPVCPDFIEDFETFVGNSDEDLELIR